MKTTDFVVIKEDIAVDAHHMHKDHEVQMAREECYHTAANAIRLHGVLKHISEVDGLPGWVSEKISLANDYVHTVLEYMEYEHLGHQGVDSALPPPPTFNMENAQQQFDSMLNEMSAGATGAASMSTSTGDGNGFGPSIFMKKQKKAKTK